MGEKVLKRDELGIWYMAELPDEEDVEFIQVEEPPEIAAEQEAIQESAVLTAGSTEGEMKTNAFGQVPEKPKLKPPKIKATKPKKKKPGGESMKNYIKRMNRKGIS